MTKTLINLQDTFLNQVRKENIPVTVYLISGVQLKGMIRGFDNFTVALENEGKQLLVYKHAISTVTPARAVGYAAFLEGKQEREVE
jgi:host factor-I protein